MTAITDAALKDVGQLVNVKELDLGGTPITDAGLEHLRRLTQLEKLDLAAQKVDRRRAGNTFKDSPTLSARLSATSMSGPTGFGVLIPVVW